MKQHHSPQIRLISLLLCAAVLLGLLPPLVLRATAKGYNGVIAESDKDYGPISLVPSALCGNQEYMTAYVSNGGKLSLNGRFKLVKSQNYDGDENRLPTGTIQGDKCAMWFASYGLELTDEEVEFINRSDGVWFKANLIPDYHTHNYIVKKTKHWSIPAFSISGPNAEGGNSWVYKTNARNGDPGYDRVFSGQASEKNDKESQPYQKYWDTLPRDGDIFFNAYQLWNVDCGDSEVSGALFYATIGSRPYINGFRLKYPDGDYLNSKNSLSEESTKLQLVLTTNTPIRFADNREHDLSGVKVYLDMEFLEYSDYTGSQKIEATFDHMTENSFVFNFTVKKSWKHFMITGVSGDKFGLNKETDLVVWDCNGDPLDAVKMKSDTYFSDFYGNPMAVFDGKWYKEGYLFDSQAPEATKVELIKTEGSEVPLFNEETKGQWDQNSGNKADVYVGVGDEISLKVYFDETISLTNQNNACAVLSIRQGISPIRVKVKRVEDKCVTFESFKIEEGMLEPGELIYIEKMENFTVRDQVGNSTTLTDMTKMKPNQEARLDVGKPYAVTTATLQTGSTVYDAYADSSSAYRFSFPVKFHDEAASGNGSTGVSGTGVKFMLEMADNTMDLPYRWYMDTRQEIRSDAVWKPGVIGGENIQLDIAENQIYWIHVELDKAVDYHYNLDDDGIWFNGDLTFHYVMDWAGNQAETVSYPLRLQVDREAPAVSFASNLSMKTEFLNNNDVNLDFAVKFSGTDNYALKYFYYWWEETNEKGEFVPVGDGFTRIDVSNGMNSQEVREITFSKTVDPNSRGKVRVKVYVEDQLGYVSDTITCEPASWIFGGIKNHSTVTENDIFSPTRTVSIDMNAPTTEGETANTPAAMLVIPDMDSRNADGEYTEFWIWSTKSSYNNYNPLDKYIEWYEDDFYWYDRVVGDLSKVKGTIDVENAEGTFTEVLQLNVQPEDLAEEMKETVTAAQKELYDYLTTYYGTMELYTVATYSVDDDFTNLNFKSAESAINTYTVYLAHDIVYDLEWTVVNAEGQTDAEAEAAGGVKLDYSGGYPATSLDNASVTLKITNVTDANGRNGVKYGFDFVDFSEGNGAFALYYTENNQYNHTNSYDAVFRYTDWTPIKTWDLVESADGVNTVVLEPGLCDKNGCYVLTFQYTNTYTGKTEKLVLGGFFMDATTLDISIGDFEKSLGWNNDTDASYEESFDWMLEDIGDRYSEGEEIRLGLAPLPEGWEYSGVFNSNDGLWYDTQLSFTSTKRPADDAANYITDNLAVIRVYNATYNAQAGLDSDASFGWIDTSDVSNKIHTFVPYLAELDAQEPYGKIENCCKLPFVDGMNLLVYEVRASNGIVTSHEMIIYVEGTEPEWDLGYSVSTNETTGMPTGITVWPVDAEGFPLNLNGSQPEDDTKYYDQTRYNFREVSNYNENFKAEYQYGTSVKDRGYLLIDPWGNISMKTLTVYDDDGETVLFIDSEEPAYSQFYLCSDENCIAGHLPANLERYNNMDTFHVMVSTEDWLDYDGTSNGSPIDPNSLKIYFDEEYSMLLDGEKDESGRVCMSIPLARDEAGNLLMNEDGTYAVWEDLENPINGIYRTQIKNLTHAQIEVAIWGLWKANNDPSFALSDTRTLWISGADIYGNEQSGFSYDQAFGPYVVTNGYSFGVGSYAEDVVWEDPWDSVGTGTTDTIIENMPDGEGVLGIYSTVPFLNVSGWGVDPKEMVEVLVTHDADPLNDYDEIEHISPGRYYFYPAPMITEDGTYYFSVTDLFGVSYDQEPGTVEEEQSAMFHEQIPVEVNVFGEMGIQVEFSTTDPTNKSVTVYAESTGDYECLSSITADNGTVGVIDPDYPKTGYITVEENAVITIVAKDEWGDETNRRTVKVTNIDKVLEKATIEYFNQNYDPLNTEIGATEVKAVLKCDEFIITTNGPEVYTFPSGSTAGTTYTFAYQDEAGNTGSITATLPVDLREPERPEDYVDTTAPKLEASLYSYVKGSYDLVDQARNPEVVDGESRLTAQMNATPGFRTQKYRIVLHVEDESEVKILITESGAQAPVDFASVQSGCAVDGVTMTVAGRAASLEITENAMFDIHLIDSNNNVSTFAAVKLNGIDRTAPVLTPVYEPGVNEEGIATVIATFEPGEQDKFEEIIPLTPGVVSKMVQVDGTYVLRYYHIFQENGTYSFTYQDALGNTGVASAEVRGLSSEAAVVNSISWFGTAPAGHVSLSPDRSTPVNRDVTAQLSMSKAIRDVELFVYAPNAEGQMGAPVPGSAPVSVSFTAATINVTYTDNVDYRIVVRFTASETGRKGTYILPVVNCIDKTVPEVTLKGTALSNDKRTMTFTFETSKPTVLAQNSTEAHVEGLRTTHTWIATGNEPVKLTFVDKTGNQSVYEVTEFPGLDTLRLTVSYSPNADGSGATEDPANDLQLFGGSSFYVYVNKDATAKINSGASFRLKAGIWTKLETPSEAGFHILKLTDDNTGESMTELIRALPKDNVAPVIEMESSTVLVWQNASVEEMHAAIRSGVTVRDNVDTGLDFTVSGYPDSTDESGLFTLCYTAQDRSGNRISAERNLYILSENTPILRINGEVGLPYGKVFLNSGEISLTMENAQALQDQPVVIKFRKGLYTTGQMKYYAEPVENMMFEVTETGHYTIYVRAQDRTEFVTYIYVEG